MSADEVFIILLVVFFFGGFAAMEIAGRGKKAANRETAATAPEGSTTGVKPESDATLESHQEEIARNHGG